MARITTAPGGRHVHPNTGSTPRHRASYTTTAVVVFAFIFCFITLAARPASAIPGVSLFANGVLAAIFGPSTDSDSLSSATVNFESFANGSPNGQSGWSATGAAPAGPGFDHQIVTNVSAPPSFGTKSLRMSNAITAGSFGNQTFSSSLAEEAGETSAQNGGMSSGPRQNRFSAQWEFISTVPGSEQPGLSVVASPDRGDGARMSRVQMADTPTGISIIFSDYQRGLGNTCASGLNFVDTTVASGLARNAVHTIRIEMDFYDGIANDVVRVYVNGALRHVGTSWEDYFRDCESNPTRTVDSILFRTAGAAAPATAGNGFLIDNLSLNDNLGTSSTVLISNVNSQGWAFFNEGAVGSGSFVNGPAPAPLGVGSAQLVIDSNGRHNIGRVGNFGQRLDQITQLSYSSHQVSGNPAAAISLQLQVDYDVTDANNAFQGRLVFEPYQTPGNAVQQNTWQSWSAINGRWWASGAPGNTVCGQATPCSWGQLLANWPNLGIHSNPVLGAIIFRAGGPNGSPFTGSVDNFTLGINGVNTTYNFDPTQTHMVDDDGFASAGNCGGADPAYATVAAAYAAAGIGDAISVCPGTYPTAATINLNKNNTTIIAAEATKPVIQAASPIGNLFFVTASNVTLDNLEIQKTDVANQNLIAVQGNNFTAQNNLIYGPNPGGTWTATGFISRAFVISVTNNLLLQNNTIHTLRQPAYMSGNDSSGGTIANNNVSGTKGWVVEGGDFNFTGNTWGEPQNQDCDIALIPSANPAHYTPLLALSQTNDNAFICAQYPGGENGRATVHVDNSFPLNGSDNAPYALIQEGVNGALTGGEVQVASGTYVEDVTINKTVKLTGAGSGSTEISGAIGGSGSTVAIAASNVEISGFRISREGNNVTDWNNPGLNSVGLSIQGQAITNALVHDNVFQGNRTGIDINNSNGHTVRNNVITFNRTGLIFRNQTDNMTVVENSITNNWTVGVLFLDGSGGTNVPVQSAVGGTFYNNDLSDNWFGKIVDRQSGGSLPSPGANPKNFGGNWLGSTSPVVTTANSAEPGYAAQIPTTYGGGATAPGGQPDIAGPASANFMISPVLASGVDTDVETTPGRGTFGFQGDFSPVTFLVTPAPAPSAADNDYTRINNAVQAAGSADTIILSGTFNWTEANAAASWALGSDGTAATLDDYSILVPANRNNITFTAASLGSATIQGPGDLAAVNLEGVFFFNGGDNQGWVISNVRYLDFDLAIGMFNGAGGADAYNGTQIINNYIRIPSDLNAGVAPADVNQNIGIHYSFGSNQTISGNTIETPGTGVSNSAGNQFSSVVGMQSNASGGAVYTGLQITNNTLRSLGTQSADPETFLGIWENGHGHSSNITVSGNQFLNASAGNNPAVNLQRAFRLTSHSSATTTVTYANNFIQGANIGFQWLASSNFAGNQPVRLTSNTILNGATGVLVQSNGSAEIHFNRIVGNSVAGVNNATPGAVNAENNWWGCNFGPGATGAGCSGTANAALGTVDASPWLTLTTTATPNSIPQGGNSAVTSQLIINSSSVDTSASGNVPNGTPASFAGVKGTVAPATGTTTNGVTGTTFTGTAFGIGSASTTVDGQTVSSPITVEPACATLSIPDGITALPSTQVNVPINTTDLTTRGVFGYETTISYDPAVISFVGFDQVGTLSSGLTVLVNSTTPGSLGITAFSTTASPLAGTGLLLNLRFQVVGGISGTPSPINFASFVFNEGDPCNLTDGGSVTVISGDVSGIISYVNGVPTPVGVPNVTVSATGPGGNVSTATSGTGTYTLSGFGAGAYTVTPSKAALPLGSPNSAISNTDATRIAQHTLGLITLNANQIIAGDVSGNGTVSNLDATYISQWKVNIPNPGTTGTWIFQTPSRNYPSVNTTIAGENYGAILKGDVTGNWNPAEAPFFARPSEEASKDAVVVGAPRVEVMSGSRVVVPIRITSVADKGVTGYEFQVTYDPLVIEPAKVAAELAGSISEGMTIVSNAIEPGRLGVVVFGTMPMNGEGLLVNLRFGTVGAVGTSTPLSIENLMLNEGEIESTSIAGELRVVESSAPGTIRGRLLTSSGNGVPNTVVVLTSTTGEARSARSSSFGHFDFGSLIPGETYTLTVQSNRFTFIPMSVAAGDSVVNVDVIAQ